MSHADDRRVVGRGRRACAGLRREVEVQVPLRFAGGQQEVRSARPVGHLAADEKRSQSRHARACAHPRGAGRQGRSRAGRPRRHRQRPVVCVQPDGLSAARQRRRTDGIHHDAQPDSAAVPVGAQSPDAVDRWTGAAVGRESRKPRPRLVRALRREVERQHADGQHGRSRRPGVAR